MTRWHMGVAAWIAMSFAFVVFWALVIAVIVVIVRGGSSRDYTTGASPPGGADDAERILSERFARGEIDADEYTHRRDLLRSR